MSIVESATEISGVTVLKETHTFSGSESNISFAKLSNMLMALSCPMPLPPNPSTWGRVNP